MADTPHTPPGSPAPGGHGHGDNPMGQLWMAMSGASVGHHEEVPGVDPKAAQVGHEPDQFNAKTIVYVPVVVAVALVVTYLIVQGAFAFVNNRESQQVVEAKTDSTDPEVIKEFEKRNADRVKDINERAAQVRTWTAEPPKAAVPGETTGGAVPQPNLEYRQVKDFSRKDAYGNTVVDPPFIRSTPRVGPNNSPEIYPEDLRPGNFVDPFTRQRLLGESGWVVKDKVAVVKIDEMIHLVAHYAEWKKVLPVAKQPADKPAGTLGRPKMSAGGVTAPLPPAVEEKPHH